jgi:hypothetical protein
LRENRVGASLSCAVDFARSLSTWSAPSTRASQNLWIQRKSNKNPKPDAQAVELSVSAEASDVHFQDVSSRVPSSQIAFC